MDWCRQTTRHNPNQYWTRSMAPYCATGPQCVDSDRSRSVSLYHNNPHWLHCRKIESIIRLRKPPNEAIPLLITLVILSHCSTPVIWCLQTGYFVWMMHGCNPWHEGNYNTPHEIYARLQSSISFVPVIYNNAVPIFSQMFRKDIPKVGLTGELWGVFL